MINSQEQSQRGKQRKQGRGGLKYVSKEAEAKTWEWEREVARGREVEVEWSR